MRTQSRSARPRRRAAIVTVLIALGVLVTMGVSHAEPAANGGGGGSSTTAAEDPKGGDGKGDGKPDGDGKKDGKDGDGKKDGQGKGSKGDGNKDGTKDGKDGQGKDGKGKDGKGKDGKDEPAEDPNIVKGTPCTKSADACVDIPAKKAWLISDGKVMRGPVPIGPGGPGYESPRGTFNVLWKNRDHRSAEFDNAPMNFAVFFAEGGIAFHEGDVNGNSHGCIRLTRPDAEAFFNELAVDDQVQVH